MHKAAYLDLMLHDPTQSPAGNLQHLAETQLSGTHEGLTIQVLHTSQDPADPLARHVVLYVEGEQPAPDDFQGFASGVVRRLWQNPPVPAPGIASLTTAAPTMARPALLHVGEWEDYDRAEGRAPQAVAPAALVAAYAPASSCLAPVTGGSPAASTPLPVDAPRPNPVAGVFDQCPAGGDDSDTIQNTLKNRTDAASAWQTTTAGAILALPVPGSLPTERSEWTAEQQAVIKQYEGLPLQVVGYLAGARVEGPEACNCHSASDRDFHFWLVDAQGTDRSQSVVSEVTPRARAAHTGWTIETIWSLVSNQTQVRISGWLMMDPAHPDQVGQTRGTTWEIHPIVAIDVLQSDGTFKPLDTL
jgi:hypothetical protein